MKNFYAFIFLLVPSLVVAEARAQEEISKESTVQEDWFHRTDVELMRKIDSNDWEGNVRYFGGPDYHKLLIQTEPEVEDGHLEELDVDIFYARPFGRYGLWKTGINYRYRPDVDTRLGLGIEYLLPYFIETNSTFYQADNHSELDIEIEREFDLTSRWSLELALESRWSSKTIESQELGNSWNYIERSVSLHYRYNVNLHLFLEYKEEQALGKLKDNKREEGEHTQEEGLYMGFTALF